MSTKQSFLEVYQRLVLLKNKVKEDAELSSEFKKGFAYCLRYISEAKEFDKVNLQLENNKLVKTNEDLKQVIKHKNGIITGLSDKLSIISNRSRKMSDEFTHLMFTIDTRPISVFSNIDDITLEWLKNELNEYVRSSQRKNSQSYSHRTVQFLREKGFKATTL